MDDQDTLIFCQKDLYEISFAAFNHMRKNGEFCDVTIEAQNQSFAAHLIILAAGIPYFRSLFARNPAQTEKYVICIENFDARALESLIDFAYSRKVTISAENVHSLCVASHFLQLNQICDACVKFMSKRLSIENIIQVRTIASSLDNVTLNETATRFISDNFEEFCKSQDFLNLPQTFVKEIIAKDGLRISSEETVFWAVIKWVKVSPEERHDALPELLSEVRMTFLPVDFLIRQVSSEELIKTSKICSDLVDEVKNYHLLPKWRSESLKLKTTPRTHKSDSILKADIHAVYDDFFNYKFRVYHCDFENEQWFQTGEAEEDNCIEAVVAVCGSIYIFLERAILTFDPKTFVWERLKPRHEPISGAAVLPHEDMIYCFGSEKHAFMQKVRVFDTHLKQWLFENQMQTSRQWSAASSIRRCIYVSGGLGFSGNDMNRVESFDTHTGNWTEVSFMLNARSHHFSCSVNEKVYVCGGFELKPEVYDVFVDKWTLIAAPNMSSISSLIVYKNKILAFGLDSKSHEDAVTEIYNPDTGEWECGIYVPKLFEYPVVVYSQTM